VFDRLTAWDQHPDEGIKFSSGRATYRNSFDLTADEAGRVTRLQLGEVNCIARVREGIVLAVVEGAARRPPSQLADSHD
jgi:hypothetical protein